MTATRAGGSIDEERTVNAYREQYAFLVLRTVQAPLNRYERAHSDQIESESALKRVPVIVVHSQHVGNSPYIQRDRAPEYTTGHVAVVRRLCAPQLCAAMP